ncbi:DinB family protein [Arthrobacter sp. HLT1-21]
MSSMDILKEAFGRLPDAVRRAAMGLDADQLAFRPALTGGGAGNSVAWLIWHLARVQDNHLADAAKAPELWTSGGWSGLFNLNLDDSDTGYGHTSVKHRVWWRAC